MSPLSMPLNLETKIDAKRVLGLVCCLIVSTFCGCQRQAYTDFYTESMAGEIRELENRIYEYDAAYQSLEDELAILSEENAALHQSLLEAQTKSTPSSSMRSFGNSDAEVLAPPSNRLLSPKSSKPVEIPRLEDEPPRSSPKPNQPTPATPRAVDESPTTSSSKPKSATPDDEPPVIELGTPTNNPTLLAPSTSSSPTIGGSSQSSNGSNLPSPPTIPSTSPGLKAPSSEVLPPQLSPNSGSGSLPGPAGNSSFQTPPKTSLQNILPKQLDSKSIREGRIQLPEEVQQASFQTKSPTAKAPTASDRKIVEIAFHPNLCRGQNTERRDAEDGIYIVLQPKNQSGEFIDEPASLTVVALDPERPEDSARIGRWVFSKKDVDASLEPIGNAAGYHFSIPWQDAVPLGNRIQIFVRYETDDGRKLINERMIQIHVPQISSNVWMPRLPN